MANLHGGAVFDKQPGQFVGFLQGTAPVVAQVDDDALDTFVFQFGQQLAYVAGGALVVFVATPHGFEVDVERGDIDHPDLHGLVPFGHFKYMLLRGLFLQFDLVAYDGDFLAGVGRGRLGGYYLQADGRVLGPAYQLDDLVQAPADHVLETAIFALGDTHNAVRWLQVPLFIRRACGNQSGNLGVFVLHLQHCTDAFQRQAHVDVEVFRATRRKIVGVRVVQFCQGVSVHLENILGVVLLDAFELVAVAFLQRRHDVVSFFFAEPQA